MILYRKCVYAARKSKRPPVPVGFINVLALLRAVVEHIDPGEYFHSTLSVRHIAQIAETEYGLVQAVGDALPFGLPPLEPTELGTWLYGAADLGSYPPRSAIHSWGPDIAGKAWRLLMDDRG